MRKRILTIVLTAMVFMSLAGTASADPPPPCHGNGFPGCSGPGGS